MHERIKALRKALGLTQQEFAERLGSVQNTITGYETGRRSPSNQVIALICREFQVREAWLREGTGEMFAPRSPDERIADFAGSLFSQEEDAFPRRFVAMLAGLSQEEWAVLERMADALARDTKKD